MPGAYQRDLDAIDKSLQLSQKTPAQKLVALHAFFRDNFHYSMVQAGSFPWVRPLSDFLLHRRAGHCEYFATATVLLLRQAGVPARYAVGYAVSEYSHLQHQYIARSRDAHAWAEAYIDGRWQTVDNTPADWRHEEDIRAPFWQPLTDFGAWLSYTFAHWRNNEEDDHTLLLWALLPLSATLFWRLRQRQRIRLAAAATAIRSRRPLLGSDSEILALLNRIEGSDLEPRAGETLMAWGRRVLKYPAVETDLQALLRLHYRYRFDPHGLTPLQRQALRSGAAELSGYVLRKRSATAV